MYEPSEKKVRNQICSCSLVSLSKVEVYSSLTPLQTNITQHFLCIKRGNLVGRYMLQDNAKPAWHSDKRSTPERVQDAVDEMVDKLQDEVV